MWPKMAAPAPAIITAFQPEGREEEMEGKLHPFKDGDQKWHTTLPLIYHWLEFGHRVTPRWQGSLGSVVFSKHYHPDFLWGIGFCM